LGNAIEAWMLVTLLLLRLNPAVLTSSCTNPPSEMHTTNQSWQTIATTTTTEMEKCT
jgi:hypothetical protein